jgi:Methyltransferase domain
MIPDARSRQVAAELLAGDDPAAGFERLYQAAAAGKAVVPWRRGAPNPLLVEWARAQQIAGGGRRALVVGSGFGDDAEFVAGLGFDTVAFDVAPTAVESARRRFPESTVRYQVADLLDPPGEWPESFDLVVEIMTVQSLPEPQRSEAIARVRQMVAAGGTLLVIATARDEEGPPSKGPPWPLARSTLESFAAGILRPARIELIPDSQEPAFRRWRAEFDRPNA